MRLLVVLSIVAFTALVYAEKCSDTRSCYQHGTTHCDHHTHAFCNQDIHQCVCAEGPVSSGTNCTARADCTHCRQGTNAHCVDRHCVCTRF